MNSDCSIRPYRPGDREALRAICCDTGFLGRPVDELFEDRELFADFQTAYYTDAEPESAWVMEEDGRVVGYLIACLDEARHRAFMRRRMPGMLLRAAGRWLTGRYNRATRRYLRWLLFRGWRETPRRPADAAHFHFNLLPSARGAGATKALFDAFAARLEMSSARRAYGQMIVRDARRRAFFERFGWKLTDLKPVTKFRHATDENLYLATIEKEFRAAT